MEIDPACPEYLDKTAELEFALKNNILDRVAVEHEKLLDQVEALKQWREKYMQKKLKHKIL